MHASVCDIITDLVQNAVEAGAKRVELDVATGPERVSVRVSDNGKGMDAATLKRVSDPFFTEAGKHDHRRVGLGIPLLLQTAEASGGEKTDAGVVRVDDCPGGNMYRTRSARDGERD